MAETFSEGVTSSLDEQVEMVLEGSQKREKTEVKWVAQIKTKTKHVHYRADATTHLTLLISCR